MYPYFRIANTVLWTKRDPSFTPESIYIREYRVRLMDRDIYPELNNGRYYQMADVSRIDYAIRSGLLPLVYKNKWSLVAGGSSSQWRRRIRSRQKYQISTQIVDYDRLWFYFYHEFRRGEVKHASILFRGGVTSKTGLIPAREVIAAMGHEGWQPSRHPWVQSWIESEAFRPKL